ncbi:MULTISPECIES: Acg family FMN-binding oxidoreductase [Nocardia]|uniref:Acg family FMN-binding oxidoreductase n=1 Tax=Nocardia TaxID=1817 RepID=UPI000D69D81B|nr:MULTISPECIES: NAD(P)H nitroreductase [Nocardia]
MEHGMPDDATVRAALALAVRAPSVHNTQPWRWRIGDRTIHLYLDPTRALPATDPDQRDMLLSCGAALHHFSVASTALGWSTIVHRLPDPEDPNHLAAIELVRNHPTPIDVALSEAITRRQTDRRRYGSWPIPPGHRGLLVERAGALGAILRPVADRARDRLIETTRAAAAQHAQDPEYLFELTIWSGRHSTSDGVPTRNTPSPRPKDELPARKFAGGELVDTAEQPDAAQLLVLGTSADDRVSRLRAGEALSAVLLTATNIGLATCALTEALEIPELRRQVRVGVLDDSAYPQVIVRFGWAPTSAPPLPETPRRTVDEVLDRFEIRR